MTDNDFFGIKYAVQQRSEAESSSSGKTEPSGSDFFDEAFFSEASRKPGIQSSPDEVVDEQRPRSGTEFLDEAFFGDQTRRREQRTEDSEDLPQFVPPRRNKIEVIESPYIQLEDSTGLERLKDLIEPVWKFSSEDLISLLSKRIVYDSDDLIAFDKPYQMAYSGAPSNQAQMDRILQDLKNVVAPKIDRLHVIKTLDKACSGVIMFAKNPDAQKKYQDMIQKNQVEFEYRTIVKNVPQKLEACINIPLRRFTAGQDFEMRPLVKTTKDKVHYVKTNYDTIMTNNRDHCAYLRVNVTNEIPHQIRSHLGYGIGCPILGDKKYNHVGQKSPQTLSSGILSKFEMKPSQVSKMPMFLHLKEVHISGAVTKHKFDSSIRASTPEFFKFALKKLYLLKK